MTGPATRPAIPALLWPGDDRAGETCSDAAALAAMVRVEQAWLDVLVAQGVAPAEAGADLGALVPGGEPGGDPGGDLAAIARAAGETGTPVVPLVALLRERAPGATATWLHRGLTSQDVLDTALQLVARDAVDRLRGALADQVDLLVGLVGAHRRTRCVARTLTQHAVPTTFAARAAAWLVGLLDADDDLAALRFPVQLGGAAGTLSGLVELAGEEGARVCRAALPPALGLAPATPWHTARAPVTRLGDATARATDAWGRLARDVLEGSRPEVGELAEGAGGGSSTMPHKANPVQAVLLRRTAIAAPPLAATLHAAAAAQVDERADGGWHAEWDTLATLLRRAVGAGEAATTLLAGLRVDAAAMAARHDAALGDLRAEQRGLAGLTGAAPAAAYDGLVDDVVDEVLARARPTSPGPEPEEIP